MIETSTYLENAFRGVDTTSPPDGLPAGFLTQADDCVFSGNLGDGGVLQTRPGFRGVLSSTLASTYIGQGATFRANDGTQYYVFVAGSSATDTSGALYRWTKGGTSVTTVSLGGVTFNVGNTQMCRFDNYVYIVGATDGKVYRYDPASNVFEGTIGATTPTYTAGASLTNSPLAPMNSNTYFACDVHPSTGITPDNNVFADCAITRSPNTVLDSTGGSKWYVLGSTPVGIESIQQTGLDGTLKDFIRLDTVGDGFISNVYYPNVQKTVPKFGSMSNENTPRYVTHWVLSFQFLATSATDAVDVTLFAYATNSGSPLPVATMTKRHVATSTGNAYLVTMTFTTSGQCDDTEPLYLKLQFVCASGVQGDHGPYVYLPVINTQTVGGLNIIPSASTYPGALVVCGYDTGFLSSDLHMVLNYGDENGGSPQNLSAYSQLVIKYQPLISGMPDPRLKLRLRHGANLGAAISDATPSDSAEMQLYTDTTGTKYYTVDISTLTRTNVWLIDIIFIADVTPPYDLTGGTPAFIIGPIINAGNLSVGYSPYTYAVRERLATTNYLSQAIYASPALVPNAITATGQLVYSASVPTNASAVTEIWRAGGTFVDGLYRKVAEITAGSISSGSTYCTYTSGTKTFTDSTPDSALQGAATMTDHTAPAFGTSAAWGSASAVSVFAGRLAIGTTTTSTTGVTPGLFLSQVAYGGENGLYWDITNNLAAANLTTQGWYRRISGNENANSGTAIVKLIPFEQTLIIMFKDMIAKLYGSDPSTFDLQPYRGTNQRGAIAHQAITLFENKVWFLAEDGLRVYDGNEIAKVSTRIDASLNPQSTLTGVPLNATAYGQAALWSHGPRLFLSAPYASGDTTPTCVWVRDEIAGGEWVRWVKSKITGGFVFASAADQNDLYATDQNGQIYKITGGTYGDAATSGGSVSAVTMSVSTRWYATADRKLKAQLGAFSASTNDSTSATYTYTATADGDSTAKIYTLTFTGGPGDTNQARIRVSSRVFGRYFQIAFTAVPATATKYCLLRRLSLSATPSRMV